MKSLQLRGWQQEAFRLYLEQRALGRRSSLWEATPGAGKTTAALQVVRHQLAQRLARRALIVVPTSHLRIQWARAAAKAGIQLDCEFGGTRDALTGDYHGAIVTYQQIGNRPQFFKRLAENTVVVLDEVHHAGDGLTWGNATKAALESASFVLCLSGTAFRSDNNPIPFVHYDEDGSSVPDFCYSYAKAVQDRVCRPTAVFTYGGEVTWLEQDKPVAASFGDNLDGIASARRLRAAIEPESGWILPLLKDAHEMLLQIRREHPAAGGLMVCADQTHARKLARLIQTVSGQKPTVVLSDDAGASKKIKQFSDDSSFWLVACNMVSEGVDIPRLRVGVYGTTIRTKMYFRQFLGRIVRREAHVPGMQVSYLYLPADPALHQLAEEIEAECRHSIRKVLPFMEDERKERLEKEKLPPQWTPLQAVNSGVDAVIVHGNQLALFSGMGGAQSVEAVVQKEVQEHFEERLTRSEEKNKLSTQIKQMVGSLHRRSGKSHSIIHTMLNKAQSVRSQTQCTEQQLRDRLRIIEKMLAA